MPATPANQGSRYPSPAAAAQTSWFINPSSGSDTADGTNSHPLRTDRERARRIGSQRVDVAMTVTILGDLVAGDAVTLPHVGSAGLFVVTGSSGSTALHSGSLTGATAPSGNTPATISDSVIDWSTAGPGSTSLVGFRIRITSGARAGAVAIIARQVSAHVVEIGQAKIISLSAGNPYGLTNVSLQTGDAYVVEKLPNARDIQVPYQLYAGVAGGVTTRVIVEGLSWGTSTLDMFVPVTGDMNAIAFAGCNLAAMDGSYTAHSCSFPRGATWRTGTHSLLGCVLFGTNLVDTGGEGVWGDATYIVGGTGVQINGSLTVVSNIYCSQSSVDGFTVGPSSYITAEPNAVICGSGNAGYGMRLVTTGQLTYDLGTAALPTVTGALNDAIVSGVAFSWGVVQFGSGTFIVPDGTMVTPLTAGPVGLFFAVPFVLSVSFPAVPPTATQVGVLAQLGFSGPSLQIPIDGFGIRFLAPWTYDGTHTIDVSVELWLDTTLFFVVTSTSVAASASEGAFVTIPTVNISNFVAGVGFDLRVRVVNNDPTQTINVSGVAFT